jgi:hypothetical protein
LILLTVNFKEKGKFEVLNERFDGKLNDEIEVLGVGFGVASQILIFHIIL